MINTTCRGTGKFVFLQQGVNEPFHLSEVEVYGTELEIPIVSGRCLDIRYDEHNYYEGTLSTAANNTNCLVFSDAFEYPTDINFRQIHKSSFASYKNYCRNPDFTLHQWCMTSLSPDIYKECNLRRCTNIDEVYSQLLSFRKPTEMSAEYSYKHTAAKGVDGIFNNYFETRDASKWWRVDLTIRCEIKFILLFNRYDVDGERLAQITIKVGLNLTSLTQCAEFNGPGITHGLYNISCKATGKIVELTQAVNQPFHVSEVEVYGETLESAPSLAFKKPTEMSSSTVLTSDRGVDGNVNTYFETQYENINWWRVDLVDFYQIRLVQIRTFLWGSTRFRRVTISLGGFNDNVTPCNYFTGPGTNSKLYSISCQGLGRIVQLSQSLQITLSEITVYGDKLVDGNWADWTCSSVCKSVNVGCNKIRTCTNPKPKLGGEDCPGRNISNEKCPIDGQWSKWSSCKSVCLPGVVECMKQRNCSNPSPQFNGTYCKGDNSMKQMCPIDGQWSEWSSCKSVCVTGVVECMKQRNCSNPRPQFNGTDCKGDNSMKQMCPIDGQWSEWSSCKSVCVPGVVECVTQRNCSNPSPQFNGTYCKGEQSIKKMCPINGNWSDWTCPSVCKSVDVGCNKTRTCTSPKPQYGGEDCSGKNSSQEKCPLDGQWSEWTSCKSVCVPGVVKCIKQRNCSNPSPQFNGTYCKGEKSMNETCLSSPGAKSISLIYYANFLWLLIFIIIMIIIWRYLSNEKKKTQMQNEEYEMAIAGLYGNEVNPEDAPPKIDEANPKIAE